MNVRESLGADHEAIDRRLSDLANAVEGADFPTILQVFRETDRSLRAHIDGEERYLFNRFEELHPRVIRELRDDHERFRGALDELMIQTELHTLRKEAIDDLAAQLRAHAHKENNTLYKWAHEPAEHEERDALFAFLEERRMALREPSTMAGFRPRFHTLVEVFESSVHEHADRPLFGTKQQGLWHWMTYAEFGDRTRRMRTALEKLGVRAGDRVAVIAGNRPEWAIGAYASYGLGAAYIAMYESQLDKDWQYILKDCEAKLLFVSSADIAERVRRFRHELPELEHVVLFSGAPGQGEQAYADLLQNPPSQLLDPGPDAIADFIYTSGTTGNPKGVLLTHRNIAYNVSAVREVLPVACDDRTLSFLPWAHSFGQTCELHLGLSAGLSIGLVESIDKLVANLLEVRPTIFVSVPRVFNRIHDALNQRMTEAGGPKKAVFDAAIKTAQRRKQLAADGRRSVWLDLQFRILDGVVLSKVRQSLGGRLKYAISGGAAISVEVAEFIDNLGITVYEGYGLSETSPIATVNYPGNRKIGSVGKAIPGVKIEIDTTAIEDPDQGEIIIYGHNVMKGYYKLDEDNETALVMKEGQRGLRTGDIGHVDHEGFLYVTGRVKEQYKLLNGKYVVPTPIEEKLKLSPYISNVMVAGANREFNIGVVIPDFVVLRKWAAEEGLDPDPAALVNEPALHALLEAEIDRLSADFKGYDKIRAFHVGTEDFTTDNGMLTPTMKVKRRVVQDHYSDAIESLYRAEPRRPTDSPTRDTESVDADASRRA